MNVKCQIEIHNDPLLSRFIRENSYNYKLLNRDSNTINIIKEEMKHKYKLTTEDRLIGISNKIATINEFMNIMK